LPRIYTRRFANYVLPQLEQFRTQLSQIPPRSSNLNCAVDSDHNLIDYDFVKLLQNLIEIHLAYYFIRKLSRFGQLQGPFLHLDFD
jgi:hypothetical protein